MIDFIKKYGVHKDTLRRILCHKLHCNFPGIYIGLKTICGFFASNSATTLLRNRDHYDRYQPSPGNGFQSENFGKRKNVSLEGFAATYTLPDGKNVTNF